MTHLIEKARKIAFDGIQRSETKDEAVGIMLFILEVYNEHELVEAYLKKCELLESKE